MVIELSDLLNEICPVCLKTTIVTELFNDAEFIWGNIADMLEKWAPIGWMETNEQITIYHKYCLEQVQ